VSAWGVGQQILDLLIGVRIPGGQPVKGTGLILTETHSPRRIGRSVGALLAGFVAVVVLSLGTDWALHAAGVFPALGQKMSDALFVLATVYRTLYGVVGSYVTARLAPDRPMGHALVGGLIGVAMSTLGAVVTWNKDLGPHWYPLALIVTAVPTAWLGGKLRVMQLPSKRP
jgi:hypothetical protein